MMDTDCVSYDVSSQYTYCESVDICCSDDSCWIETDDGPSYSIDAVIEDICQWNSPMMQNYRFYIVEMLY